MDIMLLCSLVCIGTDRDFLKIKSIWGIDCSTKHHAGNGGGGGDDILEKMVFIKSSIDNSLFCIDPLQISPCQSA